MNLKLVFESGDYVLIGVFLLMIAMSIATWSVIVIRVWKLHQAKRANAEARDLVMSALNLKDIEQKFQAKDAPIGRMTADVIRAYRAYSNNQSGRLANMLPLNEYLVSQIRNSLSQNIRRFDSGMTILASVGATAPFIGLFGTVWGIYHALINISQSGQMSIAAVAGPIGEALVATAAGLFVAIPAVLAYNFLTRGHKTLFQDMDAFAHDLHVRLLNQKD